MRLWTDTQTEPDARITMIELDPTLDVATGCNSEVLSYRSFRSRAEQVEVLLSHARYFSEFGKQAPEHRGTLLALPIGGDTSLTEEYWNGLKVIDHKSRETLILQNLVKGNGVVCENGVLKSVSRDPSQNEKSILSSLNENQLFVFHPAGKGDFRNAQDAPTNVDIVVPCDLTGGFLSREPSQLAFNAGFFILAEEELSGDPFNRLHEAIGLVVENGKISSPPIYRRPALLGLASGSRRGDLDKIRFPHIGDHAVATEWTIEHLSISDMRIQLPGLQEFIDGSCAVTRANVEQFSEWDPESIIFVIVGSNIVAMGNARSMESKFTPPLNGFAISLPPDVGNSIDPLRNVQYYFKNRRLQSCVTGTGGWKMLLTDPLKSLHQEGLSEEYLNLRQSSLENCFPPVHLSEAYSTATNRAIMAVGIKPDGRMIVVHVEGTEPRIERNHVDSSGSSLSRVRQIFIDLGCTVAMALDCGGSATISSKGRLLTKPADRFGIPMVGLERAIPGAWCVKS